MSECRQEQPPIELLVVDDDVALADAIATGLALEGYRVIVAHSGHEGLLAARQRGPALVILDRLLPDVDGLDVCRRLRQMADVPIIMLTGLDDPGDRVAGLQEGASDYMGKPFLLDELVARVGAQLRAHAAAVPQRLLFADLTLDPEAHAVWRAGESLSLTPREFDLLAYFMAHPRLVRTRSQILDAVWGVDDGDSNLVEVYVGYLRGKLEIDGQDRLIQTVRGVGYVLKEVDAAND